MHWKIDFSSSAEKEFAKLPRDIKVQINKYLISKISIEPRLYGKSLKNF